MPLLRLTPLFEQYATLLRPTVIAPAQGEGFSGAEIYRATSPLGEFALRCWPEEHPSTGHIQTIHLLLARAHERGCTFVPKPIANLAGNTLIEFEHRRWQLEPWMPGTPDLTPKPKDKRLFAAIQALAQLHAAVGADGSTPRIPEPSPALRERSRVLSGCLAGDLDRVRAEIERVTQPEWRQRALRYFDLFERGVPGVDLLLQRASVHDYSLQPVIRDVHREHILFADDESNGPQVTGLVDFGATTIDHPAIDLARILGSYEIDDPAFRRKLLDEYSPWLTSTERLLVDAFDRSGALLSPFRWLWWLFVERRMFRDPTAVARRFDVLLQRLTRLVDDGSPPGGATLYL